VDERILPYRGAFGSPRPPGLSALALPPAAMPARLGARPLKAWRYVGVYGVEVMLCLAAVRIGPARQAFWAVWDRDEYRLRKRTVIGRGPVRLCRGGARLEDRDIRLELTLEETAGVESICAAGEGYAWTRKQGGVRARGTIWIEGRPRELDTRAVIDDTAAYYPRHTSWRWSAGVGTTRDGRAVAWNLVSGVNDPQSGSERSVWVDGRAVEVRASTFAADLSAVDGLRFEAEAELGRRQNLLLIRSSYRQPFGTFSGTLPGGLDDPERRGRLDAPERRGRLDDPERGGPLELAEGYGVMEEHDVWW
jgi:hypothetical protein